MNKTLQLVLGLQIAMATYAAKLLVFMTITKSHWPQRIIV
jgi:hypothetical protein